MDLKAADLRQVECFFVAGETSADDLGQWKAAHPEFIEWDQEWFNTRFVQTETFLLSNDDGGFGNGGSLLLFATREAAEEYGSRDAAIASGRRSVELVIAVHVDAFCPVEEDYDSDDSVQMERFEQANEAFKEIVWSTEATAVLETGETGSYWVLLYPDDENGRRRLNQLVTKLQQFRQAHFERGQP